MPRRRATAAAEAPSAIAASVAPAAFRPPEPVPDDRIWPRTPCVVRRPKGRHVLQIDVSGVSQLIAHAWLMRETTEPSFLRAKLSPRWNEKAGARPIQHRREKAQTALMVIRVRAALLSE
jgi:hypothetical protein